MEAKLRVLSGIQPTGRIHIGNYLGAVKQWVSAQDARQNLFCLVDLHAITVPQDPAHLKRQTREVAAILYACGIDPKKSALFIQSQVAAHTELAWILTCIATMGQLSRMTQFKAKTQDLRDEARVGLFTYPTLMAADILLYQTDLVPVGADQKQHVELTRDLAQRFNATFGETFKVPAPTIPTIAARVMGLDDATKKMSKSDPNPNHAVCILDAPELILKKLKSAKTDSGSDIRFDETRPGVTNLLTIHQAMSGKTREELETHFTGKGYGHLKIEVAEVINETLKPIRERFDALMKDPAELDRMLAMGAETARSIADLTMRDVRSRVGLG